MRNILRALGTWDAPYYNCVDCDFDDTFDDSADLARVCQTSQHGCASALGRIVFG